MKYSIWVSLLSYFRTIVKTNVEEKRDSGVAGQANLWKDFGMS